MNQEVLESALHLYDQKCKEYIYIHIYICIVVIVSYNLKWFYADVIR